MSLPGVLASDLALESVGWALLSLGGVLLSVLCSGCEMGVYAVNRVRLHVRAAAGGGGPGGGDRLASLLNNELREPGGVLACLLVGNNLANWCIGLGLTALLTGAGYSEGAIVVISTLVLTPVLFVACDALPKEVFRGGAEVLMYAAAPFVRGLRLLLTYSGIMPSVHVVSRLVGRLARARSVEEAEEQSARARMAVLLKEGAGAGAISEQQAELLDRAFGLRTTLVGDEMVPWAAVRVMPAGLGRPAALAWLAERGGGWSRYPVVGPRGEVAGVLERALLCVERGKGPAELMGEVVRLAPSLTVRQGLAALASRGARMGVVYDADRPVGIVTAKDLVEPLTGELKAW